MSNDLYEYLTYPCHIECVILHLEGDKNEYVRHGTGTGCIA